MTRTLIAALAAATLAAGVASAQDFTPAIIFDMGGKFDKSFNEAAYNGAERFKEETGIEYLEFEVTNESQRDQALRRMARRGANVVVAVGFSFATPLEADRQGVPRHQVRDHRFGGRAAQRAVGRVQGARGLVPGRHGGGAGLQDRQGRLRRRHGHPADPQLRPRLRAGRQARQPRRRGVRQHDRHDAGRLERSGQGRRARPEPVRPRRRRGLRRRRRHRPRRAAGRGRFRQALDRRRQQPELPASRQRADLDAQAGRRRGLQRLQGRDGGRAGARRAEPRPRRGRRRLCPRRAQPRADHARDGEPARGRQGQDHRRRDRGGTTTRPSERAARRWPRRGCRSGRRRSGRRRSS